MKMWQWFGAGLLWTVVALPSGLGQGIDLDEVFEERNLEPVQRLLKRGEYEFVAQVGEMAMEQEMQSVAWRWMRLEALRELGDLRLALAEVEGMLERYPEDLRLWWWQYELSEALGESGLQQDALEGLNRVAQGRPAAERSALDWVVLGEAALKLGADANAVIGSYFNQARKVDAELEQSYLAEGWLALDKSDPKAAAEAFRDGLKQHGESADLRFGLAVALRGSDRAATAENLLRALERNPRHLDSILLQAELAIQAEDYELAEEYLQTVLKTDPDRPEPWAMRAAMVAIQTVNPKQVEAHRRRAWKRWEGNPAVDHWIGRLLSGAYRFAEGAWYQRQALKADADYLPAMEQLCHDLLRLGEEEEAWQLAEKVRQTDGYHIGAHNLGILQQELDTFVEHREGGFTIRMPKNEWPVYGRRALDLLLEARDVLTRRYQVDLPRSVLVEFFPSQQDFAIRTFGNLGGQGILGACFGSVVTMNSPGSLAHGRSNWESTLWHEFCHVVTLTATRNRMPRWLSEGISVYEEARRDPAWGMPLTEGYRELILSGESTPVSELSRAFLQPESPDHLMFAYYQAGQVVTHLVQEYGEERLLRVLEDLAAGQTINQTLQKRTGSLKKLDRDIEELLQTQAEAFGALADWEEPEAEEVNPADPESVTAFLAERPDSLWGLRRQLGTSLEQEDWKAVEELATRLAALLPEDPAPDGALWWLSRAQRELDQPEQEGESLGQLVARNASAMGAQLRLLALSESLEDWENVARTADRITAINPFLTGPWEARAKAGERLAEVGMATSSLETLLQLGPRNRVQVHFRLAKLQVREDPMAARKHLLEALVEAPRYREAQRLLLELEP